MTAARAVLVALLLSSAGPVLAAGRPVIFTLAIGYNGAPRTGDGREAPPALRFADDDAAAFYQFGRSVGRRAYLLALLDADTQRRFPGLAAEARAPSLEQLNLVVAELNDQAAAAERAGDQPVVIISYSGHGVLDERGRGALTLLDGRLDQATLYQRVLAALRVRYVHLFIDACHAEAVVRPRDAQAQMVKLSGDELAGYISGATLDRFPHVGAIVASTANTEAHEWEVYRGGVFTHEVLSGLRGAADVNGDSLLEYSELAAFLSAANGAVTDPRARLDTVVRPPSLNPRAPIVELRGAGGLARLEGEPAALGGIYIEDGRGVRLVDLRTEPGFGVTLVLPPGQDLFLRAADREAELRLPGSGRVRLERLSWRALPMGKRGAIDASLRRGLFGTRFGRAYYQGFVDRDRDLVAVDLPVPEGAISGAPPPTPPARGHSAGRWTLIGAAGLAAGAAVAGGLALDARSDFERTNLQREAVSARDRYQTAGMAAVGLAATSAIVAAVGLWLGASDR